MGTTIKNAMTNSPLFGNIGMENGCHEICFGGKSRVIVRHVQVHQESPAGIHCIRRLSHQRNLMLGMYAFHNYFPEFHTFFRHVDVVVWMGICPGGFQLRLQSNKREGEPRQVTVHFHAFGPSF
jgi:hypothetical protein